MEVREAGFLFRAALLNMKEENSEYFEEFIEDMTGLLENMANNLSLLKSKKKYDFKNVINEIFRYAHSLKGMAAAMEFLKMEALTHKMEDVLYEIRDEKLEYNNDILELFCRAYKYLKKILESIESSGGEDEDVLEGIEDLTKKLASYVKKDDIETEKGLGKKNKVFEIKEENYNKIKNKIDKKEKVYFFKLYINKDSSFKMVRAFMCMECIKKNTEFFQSFPEESNISNGEGELYENVVVGLFSVENLENLYNEIMKISEVDDFETEIIKDIKKEYLLEELIEKKEKVELEKESEDNIKNEIENGNYSEEINNESKEKVMEIIQILDEIDEDADVKTLIMQIKENLEFIQELAQVFTTSKRDMILEELLKIIENISKNGYQYSEEKKYIINEYCKCIIKMYIDKNYENQIEFGKIINELKEKSDKILNKSDNSDLLTEDDMGQNKTVVQSSGDIHENIRIPAVKADILVDMLEELIVVQSQIRQQALDKFNQDSEFSKNLSKMFRITKDIQDLSISFRMITLKSIFQKVKITVRDTAGRVNKKIDLEIIGEDTEIDRLVANRILDPMLHLVKNSIAHGIETKEERIEAGKPERGNVVIVAYSVKGHVYIEVSDDGRGIDTGKVYKKAKEKGIVDEKKNYTQEEIVEFIMLPGFSTSDKIDKISGRGVGMDVVKTEVSKLGGKITIENSPGLGCKFTIRVPKNMTAMNGTIVDIAGKKYIIPTNYIKEIFKVDEEKWITIKGIREKVKLRDKIINFIHMEKYFDVNENKDYEKIVVVLEVDKVLKAITVTDILERREVVVKSIGDDFASVKHIFGAAILGDGNASLILDIENIFKNE